METNTNTIVPENQGIEEQISEQNVNPGMGEENASETKSKSEENAFAILTRKLKEAEDRISELAPFKEKAEALEPEFTKIHKEYEELKLVQDERANTSNAVLKFADEYKIPHNVLGEILDKYSELEVTKNNKALDKFLLSNHLEELKSYMTGSTGEVKKTPEPTSIHVSGGAPVPQQVSARDAARAYVENKKNTTVGLFGLKVPNRK